MYFFLIKIEKIRPSLVAQWFRLWSSTTGGTGLTPGWGTKIPPQKNEKKKKRKALFSYMKWMFYVMNQRIIQ